MSEPWLEWADNIRRHAHNAERVKDALAKLGPEAVRETQTALGCSLRKLAATVGCSPAYLSGVVLKRFQVSPGTFLKLADLARKGVSDDNGNDN